MVDTMPKITHEVLSFCKTLGNCYIYSPDNDGRIMIGLVSVMPDIWADWQFSAMSSYTIEEHEADMLKEPWVPSVYFRRVGLDDRLFDR